MNFKIWKDILTEKSDNSNQPSYSQGRVYLFFTVIVYYITIGIVMSKALKPTLSINEETLNTVINALQWAIALFAGYAFGGKVISGVKTMFAKNILPDTTTDTTPVVTPAQTTTANTDTTQPCVSGKPTM